MAKLIGTGQLTLTDLNDVIVSPTKPSNPVEGAMWWNTTESQLYIYQNGDWQKSSNIIVGGKNLLRLSHTDFNTTDYLISPYTLTEDWVAGQQYTFVVKGTVPTGQKLGIWQNGGSTNVGYATTKFYDGVYYVTFTAQATTVGNERKLHLYNYPQNTTVATVDWVALYRGNLPMDWSKAPEETDEVIVDITETLGNMANDGILDYNERQVIKDKITDIIGYIIADNVTTLPTTATLDSGAKGTFYTVRKQAQQIGISTTHAKYVAVATKYNDLKTYLEAMTPIDAWDVSTANQKKTITVVKDTFRDKWLQFYLAVDDLATYTIQVAKENVDNVEMGGTNYASNGSFEIPLAEGIWSSSYSGDVKEIVDISTETPPFKFAYHVKNTANKNGGIFVPELWSGKACEQLVDREVTIQYWLKYQNIVQGAQTYLLGRFGELVIEGEDASGVKKYRYPRIHSDSTVTETLYISGTNTTWKKYTATIKLSLPAQAVKLTRVSFKHGLEGCTGEFWTTGIKVELGNKATDWSQSPFDLEQRIYKTEFAVKPDNITSTVTSHQTFVTKVGENIDKATSSESNYINKNYNFADWTGTYPVGFDGVIGTAVAKVASENGNGKSVKYTNALGVESYLSGVSYLNKPYYQYVYVESTFKLESGSINGAGILFRYLRADNATSAFEGRFKFSDAISSPTLNKWYTVSTVFKVPVPTDFGGYKLYAMGSYSAFDSTKPAKTIYIDSVISRPATSEEIKAYEADVSVSDMMADDKITPLEKHTLKNELDMIVAEKPTFEAKANQYMVTTEKTDYVSAYDALYSALSPHLSNLNTTATGVNGTAIRTLFKNYNDKKTVLERAILNAVQFGGRNLLRNSNFAKYRVNDGMQWDKNLNGNIVADGWWSNGYNGGTVVPTTGYHAHLNTDKFGYPVAEFIDKNSVISQPHRWLGLSNTVLTTDPLFQSLAVGKTYTISMDVMADTVGVKMNVGFHHFVNGNATQGFYGFQWDLQTATTINVWERKYKTFTVDGAWDLTKGFAFYLYGQYNSSECAMWVRNIQIEEGTRYTDWSPTPEDVDSFMYNLADRVSTAEEKITDSAITNTVIQSTSYKNDLQSKANSEDLKGYATTGQLDQAKRDANKYADDKVGSIDFTPYVVKSEMNQTVNDLTVKFQAGGGVNLLRNSVGYADFSFWGTSGSATAKSVVSNNALDALGFGKGFYFSPAPDWNFISQDVYVTAGQPYSLSWFLNKTNTNGANSDGAFWVQIREGATVMKEYVYASSFATKGFEKNSLIYVPNANIVNIRFIAYKNTDATISGIMFNTGDVPLQWSMATGEIYNTNIRMDMNGIRVSQIVDGKDRGYTQITPDEFAGYYDTSGNGVYEKVFYLKEDETVSKKFRAKDEFTMGGIKIIKIESTASKGWAFVQSLD